MNRILKISKNDILFDRKNASDILNKASLRTTPMHLTGGFETDEKIVLVLEDNYSWKNEQMEQYTIAPFSEVTEDGMIGEINSRYTAGFSICFCFKINDSNWGVFGQISK